MPGTARVALAALPYPASPEDALCRVLGAIAEAGESQADVLCFPEAYLPGYRGLGRTPPPIEPAWLRDAWNQAGLAAAAAGLTVILGTERPGLTRPRLSALVLSAAGEFAGFQDKVQLDPSEEETYEPGAGRLLFHGPGFDFGVVICHEGWRYPETVRWAARRGAAIVFHPHFHPAEPGMPGTFHRGAALCRAAENTCYFASVNYAEQNAPTETLVVQPDGTILARQPLGVEGLLLTDLDLASATGHLASRLKPV